MKQSEMKRVLVRTVVISNFRYIDFRKRSCVRRIIPLKLNIDRIVDENLQIVGIEKI